MNGIQGAAGPKGPGQVGNGNGGALSMPTFNKSKQGMP